MHSSVTSTDCPNFCKFSVYEIAWQYPSRVLLLRPLFSFWFICIYVFQSMALLEPSRVARILSSAMWMVCVFEYKSRLGFLYSLLFLTLPVIICSSQRRQSSRFPLRFRYSFQENVPVLSYVFVNMVCYRYNHFVVTDILYFFHLASRLICTYKYFYSHNRISLDLSARFIIIYMWNRFLGGCSRKCCYIITRW